MIASPLRTTWRWSALLIVVLLAVATLAPAPTNAAINPSREWQVAAPALTPISGGVSFNNWPDCRPGQIHAAAQTQSSTYAVLGVVTLRAKHCTLDVDHAVTGLLDATGHRLAIAARTPPYLDLGTADRPDLGWDDGKGSWGFTWRGSWCGNPAEYVRVELKGQHFIRARLSGPQPSCEASNDTTPLIERGIAGFPGAPVQPAPFEWSNLTVQLQVSRTLPGPRLRGLAIAITNDSGTAVTLSPCPLYTVLVKNQRGDGGDATSDHPLDCNGGPHLVPANGSLQVNLPDLTFFRQDFGRLPQQVAVTFAMAGVASSTVHSRLT